MAYNNGDDEKGMSARQNNGLSQKQQFRLLKQQLRNERVKARMEAKKELAKNPRETNININTRMGGVGINRGPQNPTRPSEEEMEPSAKPEGGKPTSSAKVKAAVMAAMGKKKKGMS